MNYIIQTGMIAMFACTSVFTSSVRAEGGGAPPAANQVEPAAATASLHGARFDEALAFVLRAEGGYSNHPADRGGATNRGITTRTYNAYRASKGLPARDVREITDDELVDIYYVNYWVPCRAEDHGRLTAIVHFDAAVNSGVNGAARLLAKAQKDFSGADAELAERYLNVRQDLYNQIVAENPGQNVFLKGWTNRVNNLRNYLGGLPPSPATLQPVPRPPLACDGTTPEAGARKSARGFLRPRRSRATLTTAMPSNTR